VHLQRREKLSQNAKRRAGSGSPLIGKNINQFLEFLEKITRRTGDIHSTRCSPLAILDPLHNARRLGALRAIRALVRVHYLGAIASLRNLSHTSLSVFPTDVTRMRVLKM
jgi:hypothetical protein